MAITASFSSGNGILSIFGDANKNSVVVSRDAAGNILVNGGAVQILGGTATVANTAKIQMFGQDGNDTITVDEANGAMPAVQMFGGNGNDILTGGSGNDMLFGQAGDDILLGQRRQRPAVRRRGQRYPDRRRRRRPGVRRGRQRPHDLESRRRHRPDRRRRRQRHRRSQRRQRRRSLHDHRQRHRACASIASPRLRSRSISAPPRTWWSTPMAATTSSRRATVLPT